MCVCVKVQLVQLTRRWSVETEVLVRTCASRLLDSQLHNICSGLEKMGGNLKKKTDDKCERIKEIWQNYQNPVRLIKLLPVAPHPPNT